MPLFDTHTHLFDDRYADDLQAVIERARAAGLVGILAVGIDLGTSQICVNQSEGDFLRAAVGIQPNHVAEAAMSDWDTIVEMASDSRVTAIGETGLDRYWDKTPFALQEECFERHLALARELGKPIVIHCRDAEGDVVRMLMAQLRPVRGVMHSFTGDRDTMERCLEAGLHISFAGMITYKSAASLGELCRFVPLDRLLIETDCPYLAPVPHRGRRNEPAYIAHTAARIAELTGMDYDELAWQTTLNAQRLFGFGEGGSTGSPSK